MLRNDTARPLGDAAAGDGCRGTGCKGGGGDLDRRLGTFVWQEDGEEARDGLRFRLVLTIEGSCSSGTSLRNSRTGVPCSHATG